ncbi:glycosyltransferase family 2 protein [Roseivirga pacifica]|uniref:glycosyltransferase family 2 protein n=1 Tax=Roseivirga pacifica TaxID=1267423 RepID=UPI003BAA30F4
MVSVIVPCYNREKTILRAIDSVLNQTYQNFELLIIDDCSSDNSVQLISELNDERIRLIKHTTNKGAAEARNTGIANAKGTFISLLDSDDFYEKTFLEKSVSFFDTKEEQVGFIWTGVRYIRNHGNSEFIWRPLPKGSLYESFLHELKIGTNSGLTFRSSVFAQCDNFRGDLPAAEDTELFLRISQSYNSSVLEEVLINIDQTNEDRLSRNYKKLANAYNIFIGDHWGRIIESKALLNKFGYKLMWLNFHAKNRAIAINYYKMLSGDNVLAFKQRMVFFLYYLLPLSLSSKCHFFLNELSKKRS